MKKSFIFLLFVSFALRADWAEDTLKKMSLEEKIAQMCVVSIEANNSLSYRKGLSLVAKHSIGGVLLDTDEKKTLITPSDKKGMIEDLQNVATIPLFIIQDMEASLAKQLESSSSSGAVGLDAIPDHRLIGILGQSVGEYMKSLGVNMLLTPVIAVDANIRNQLMGGQGTINPRELARRGFSFVNGLRRTGIITCAKHFPSEGNKNVDPHIALPVMYYDRDLMNNGELQLFKELIKSGVDGIMTSHIYIPAFDVEIVTPASLCKAIVTDLLQKELEHSGLIVTDELEIRSKTLKYSSGDFMVAAFNAGNDLVLGIDDVAQAITALSKLISSTKGLEAELDRRVLKILRAKESMCVITGPGLGDDLSKVFEDIETESSSESHSLLNTELQVSLF